jgi:hypothetical protein
VTWYSVSGYALPGGVLRMVRVICAMSAGRTRQHPPMMVAPADIHCRGCAGRYRDCPVQVRRRASQCSPLLGYTITGLPVTSWATAMAAGTSAGVQQLTLRHDVRHAGGDRERRCLLFLIVLVAGLVVTTG